MNENRIGSVVERMSDLIQREDFTVDYLLNIATKFNTNNVKDLLDLSLPQIRVLLASVSVAKNNVVELTKVEDEIKQLTGYESRTIGNALSALVKKKILIKSALTKTYLIDATYFAVGDNSKIIELHKAAEQSKKDLANKLDEHEKKSRPNFQEDILKGSLEKKRMNEEKLD